MRSFLSNNKMSNIYIYSEATVILDSQSQNKRDYTKAISK